MARRKKHAYRVGYIRETPHNTFAAEIWSNGKKHRKVFKTRPHAESYIDSIMLANLGGFQPLSESEMREAREAINLLPPGVGLLEAVRQWARENGEFKPILATKALDMMLSEKASLGRRPRSVDGLSNQVGAFLASFPDIQVHEITTADIKDWLAEMGYKGATRNNYRRDIHNFLGWCVLAKHISKNPCSDVPKANAVRSTPQCFSVDQVKFFLGALTELEPELIPYFATGFFAGIRTAELDRMDESCFRGDVIHIGPDQAKIGQQRYVEILSNLRAFLDAYPPTGKLFQRNQKKRYRAILKALDASPQTKGFKWVDNGMRHSYASHHIAAFEDSAKTATQLGHQNASLLYSTYRTLTTKAKGEEYFQITPEKLANFWQKDGEPQQNEGKSTAF